MEDGGALTRCLHPPSGLGRGLIDAALCLTWGSARKTLRCAMAWQKMGRSSKRTTLFNHLERVSVRVRVRVRCSVSLRVYVLGFWNLTKNITLYHPMKTPVSHEIWLKI